MRCKIANPRVRRKSGAPSYWAYMHLSSPTFGGDAGDVVDLIRGTAAGVRSGGCTWADGPRGKCLSFDGGSGSVTVSYSSALDLSTCSFTSLGWFRPASSGLFGLWGKPDDNYGGQFLLSMRPGWLEVASFSNTGGYSTAKSPNAPAIGVWNFVNITFNADTRTLSIALNGATPGTAVVGGPLVPSSAPLAPFMISHNGLGFNFFYGLIDDVRIYPRVLSVIEIDRDFADPDWRLRGPRRPAIAAAPAVPARSPAALLLAC